MAGRDDNMATSMFSPSDIEPGGYPKSCFDEKQLKRQYECNICSLILKVPHQDDGGRYCLRCAESHGKSEETDLMPDRAVEKQMIRDLTRCRCDREGCSFTGDFRAFRLHYESCEFDIVSCPQCVKPVKRKDLADHQVTDCERQEVDCSFCGRRFAKAKLDEHHQRECYSTICPFGCKLNGSTNMKQHHIEKMQDHVHALREKVESPQGDTSAVIQELALLDENFLDVALQRVRESVREVRSSMFGSGTEADDAVAGVQTALSALKLDDFSKLLEDDEEKKIENLAQMVNKLEESCSYMKTYITQSYKDIVDSEAGNTRNTNELEGLRSELEKLKFQFSMQVDSSKRLETEVRHLETTTNDGLFVFRIPEWSTHVQNATESESYSVYSTSFFTHQGGYRLRLRVFPIGEKDARSKFLSTYINIMKGPYDPILPWPFRRCVVLSCLDQRDMKVLSTSEFNTAMSAYQQAGAKGPAPAPVQDPRKDVSFRLRPDPTRSDHQRAFNMPNHTENPSIGFLRFVPLEQLRDSSAAAGRTSSISEPIYVRNNTLFIRCAVEPIEP